MLIAQHALSGEEKTEWDFRVKTENQFSREVTEPERKEGLVLYPQQLPASLLQSQEGGPPLMRLLMIAAAQPTPVFTAIAPNSQFKAQAPHSMHKSLSVTTARLSRISNTPCGQTSAHRLQPVHFSEL